MNDSVLPLLGAVTAFSNRVSEMVKSSMQAHWPNTSPEVISEVALAVSLIAGIVGALALNINLLVLLPADSALASIPPIVGVIITGCIASIGSEGVQFIMGLLQAKQAQIAAPPATSSSIHVDAETSSVPPPVITAAPEPLSPYRGSQPHR